MTGRRIGSSFPLSGAIARPETGVFDALWRHLPRFAEKGRRLAAQAALAVAVAAPPASAFPLSSAPTVAPQCVARVNKAALQAMDRTNPLGQMQIFGSPVVFNPHLLRVTVTVFGARAEIYSVDVTIDDACRVLSVTTRLENDNDRPYW